VLGLHQPNEQQVVFRRLCAEFDEIKVKFYGVANNNASHAFVIRQFNGNVLAAGYGTDLMRNVITELQELREGVGVARAVF